jgi:hypothetical protein
MQAHHGVVRRETELRSDPSDRHAVDDHPTKNDCVLGLELFGLHENAPTIDVALVEGREFEFVDRHHGYLPFSQFVVEHVSYDAVDPSLCPSWVTNLLRPLHRPLERHVEHLFSIDLPVAASTDKREQRGAAGSDRVANCVGGRAGVDVALHASGHSAPERPEVQPPNSVVTISVRFRAPHRPGRGRLLRRPDTNP